MSTYVYYLFEIVQNNKISSSNFILFFALVLNFELKCEFRQTNFTHT